MDNYLNGNRQLFEQIKSGIVEIEQAFTQVKNIQFDDLDLPRWITIGRSAMVILKSSSVREKR